MTWDWGGSLDRLASASTLPAWLAVSAAALFGLLFLLSLLRADPTLANAALAALTFTGLAVAAAIGLRNGPESAAERASAPALAQLPALACIDDMAGETAVAACEQVLFSAPDKIAAAVAYTAARINRLTAHGDVNAANRVMTPDLHALRNAIERDRYGLVAYVLATRDRCQPAACASYAAMTDHNQVAANMDGLIYEGLVAKYAPAWAANAGGDPSAPGPVASGKPNSVDFPTASSIPPVNIMTPEPALSRPEVMPVVPPQAASPPSPAPAASGGPYIPARSATAAKKRASSKRSAAPAAAEPVQLAPSAE